MGSLVEETKIDDLKKINIGKIETDGKTIHNIDHNGNKITIDDNIINSYNDTNDNKTDDSKITNQIETCKNKDGRSYVWIDPDINSVKNKDNLNYLQKVKKIDIKTYDNIKSCFDEYLSLEDKKFQEIVIIISGKLFYKFVQILKININKINFSPTILIFTSKIDLLIDQLKMHNMYYNNDLFDSRLIFTNPSDILDYFKDNIQEESGLTFDIIEYPEQLIIPNYYTYLLEDTYPHEIEYFNNYLLQNFPPSILNEEIHDLVKQIRNKPQPLKIIIQYWLRIYTLQSDFFGKLNKSLRNKNRNSFFYYPFIKICYEGMRKGILTPYKKEIYRCSRLNKKEFEEINNKFRQKDNNDIKEIPNIILYSRSFLSFSEAKNRALRFSKSGDEDNYSILFIIEEIKDKNKTHISNADIQSFSKMPQEKEIIVFPFTCFEILKIIKSSEDKIDFEVHLKYLENYSDFIEEKFGNNFFDKIQISKYSEELMSSGVIKANNIISKWIKKKNLLIKLDKVFFFLDGEEDCIGVSKNEIIVFNINSNELKIRIREHTDKIFNIIKLPSNRILSCSKDKTFRIFEFFNDNTEYKQTHIRDFYSSKILFLQDEKNGKILFYDIEKKTFTIHDLSAKDYEIIVLFVENDIISLLEKLNKDIIMYTSENNAGIKFINFINVKMGRKEENSIKIKEDKEKELKFVGLKSFNDYILVAFNSCIDIYQYKNRRCSIKTFNYFDYEITEISVLSNDKLILGLYDPITKSSTFREHLLRSNDLKNSKNKFDCIGRAKFEPKKMDNIIKINESKILINYKNEFCNIYEKKNEVSEKLKESLMDICITQQVKSIKKEKVEKKVKVEEKVEEKAKVEEKEKLINIPPKIISKDYIHKNNLNKINEMSEGNKTKNEAIKVENNLIYANSLPKVSNYNGEDNNRKINLKGMAKNPNFA